jgi:hypothetical protein
MTISISITAMASEAPAVRWEPCPEFHDDPAAEPTGVCAGCGWAPDDHELPAAA